MTRRRSLREDVTEIARFARLLKIGEERRQLVYVCTAAFCLPGTHEVFSRVGLSEFFRFDSCSPWRYGYGDRNVFSRPERKTGVTRPQESGAWTGKGGSYNTSGRAGRGHGAGCIFRKKRSFYGPKTPSDIVANSCMCVFSCIQQLCFGRHARSLFTKRPL